MPACITQQIPRWCTCLFFRGISGLVVFSYELTDGVSPETPATTVMIDVLPAPPQYMLLAANGSLCRCSGFAGGATLADWLCDAGCTNVRLASQLAEPSPPCTHQQSAGGSSVTECTGNQTWVSANWQRLLELQTAAAGGLADGFLYLPTAGGGRVRFDMGGLACLRQRYNLSEAAGSSNTSGAVAPIAALPDDDFWSSIRGDGVITVTDSPMQPASCSRSGRARCGRKPHANAAAGTGDSARSHGQPGVRWRWRRRRICPVAEPDDPPRQRPGEGIWPNS